jgi:hypothetical protein
MPVIEQTRTWAAVEERLAVETDPTLIHNLELLLAHMKSEAAADLDGLLETISDDASYHAYGAPPEGSPQGKPAVRKFYEDFIASGATRLALDIDRLIVDKHCILTEGVMRMAYPGSTLAARGIAVDDESAYYLYEARMATLWPFNEAGLIIGEDTYTGGNGFEGIASRKLAPEDIV